MISNCISTCLCSYWIELYISTSNCLGKSFPLFIPLLVVMNSWALYMKLYDSTVLHISLPLVTSSVSALNCVSLCVTLIWRNTVQTQNHCYQTNQHTRLYYNPICIQVRTYTCTHGNSNTIQCFENISIMFEITGASPGSRNDSRKSLNESTNDLLLKEKLLKYVYMLKPN